MAGVIKVGGASASVKLQGNDTITSDQTFTFPNTGGELAINGGGDESGSGADAWATVYGTDIENGYNIKEVDREAEGQFDFVFSTPMASEHYSVVASAQARYCGVSSQSVNGFRLVISSASGANEDPNPALPLNVAVFASNSVAPPHGVGADAWGNVNDDASVNGSFNVASVTRERTGKFVVVFTTPMPNSNYAATVSPATKSCVTRYVEVSETGFAVQTLNASSNSELDCGFSFTVHASSTVTPTYTWTRDGTTLKPANSGDDVEVDGTITANGLKNPDYGDWGFSIAHSSSQRFGTQTIQADGTNADNLNRQVFKIVTKDTGVGSSTKFAVSAVGDVRIGGTISNDAESSTPNIKLSADGSAEFGVIGANNSDQGQSKFTSVGRLQIDGTVGSGGEATSQFIQCKNNGSQKFAVAKNGQITAPNVTFNLDPDNSANYVSTMVDGEEQQVYSGPTLDVRQVLLDLQSKVEALQAEIETLKGGAS